MTAGKMQNAPPRKQQRAGRMAMTPERMTLGLLAAAVVVAYILLSPRRDYPSYDGAHYLGIARDLAMGKLTYSSFPPGFPLLVTLAVLPFGAPSPEALLHAAHLVNGLAGVALGLLAYAFARRSIARWPAVGVATLTWALPLQLRLATIDLTEPTYGCLLLAGLLLLEGRRPLRAGLVWGVAYLIRPEALLTVAAVAALELVRQRRDALRLGMGAAALVVPYVVYLYVTTGHWSFSSKMVFLERALDAPTPTVLGDSYLGQARALGTSLLGVTGLAIPIAALVGIVLRPRRWLAAAAPLLLLPVFSFPMYDRFWAPYLPLMFTSAWLGVAALLRWFGATPARAVVMAAAAAVLLGNAAMTNVVAMQDIAVRQEYFPGLRDAGTWLRPRVDRTTIVAARKPYVSFWAGCQFARIPDGLDPVAIVAWARRQGAGWLVVNVFEVVTLVPSLRPLAEDIPEAVRGQIEPAEMFQVEGRPEQTTYLYRVLPADPR